VSACSRPEIVTPAPVEVRTIQVSRPAPIVPGIDQLRLRDVGWIIITPENAETVFASLSGDVVLFAITSDGYEDLSLNLSDVRALIQQQQRVIAIYQNSYRR
jgi:hypothetical protein